MLHHNVINSLTESWRHPVLGAFALLLSLTGFSQSAERASEDQIVRFSEETAIRSTDGGHTWGLKEGILEEVPYWAQTWLKKDLNVVAEVWAPKSVILELENGGILSRTSGENEWKLESSEQEAIPNWARRWLKDAPIRMPTELAAIPVQSLCQGEKPMQRTQTFQIGADLAIRSFDGGYTWVMAEGNREDLPDWAEAWLNQPVVEVQPAKELVYGDALIRSVDGGNTWTLVRGTMEDLPSWVRPWLGDAYPTASPMAEAGEAEGSLKEGFELFPNPSQSTVTLRFNLERDQNVRVLLYDLQGRLLKEVQSGNLYAGIKELNFSVSDLSAGPYFLQINTEDQQERIRLLRSH